MSMNRLHITLLLLILGSVCFSNAASTAVFRPRRQTYVYDESLKQYARPHLRTKIMTGTVGRYAPHEWPDWYTRTILKWNGEFRMGPYHPNDIRYERYQRSRNQILNFSKRR